MIDVERFEDGRYLFETREIIRKLVGEPTTRLVCAHGDDDPVIGVFEVPGGCVALPGVDVQPLCMHHRMSDGSFNGMRLIIDLSMNPGWLEQMGDNPDFIMVEEGGEFTLKENPA
jgi:hypothetical protein